MLTPYRWFRRIFMHEEGATLVQCSLMAALLAVACLTVVSAFGTDLREVLRYLLHAF